MTPWALPPLPPSTHTHTHPNTHPYSHRTYSHHRTTPHHAVPRRIAPHRTILHRAPPNTEARNVLAAVKTIAGFGWQLIHVAGFDSSILSQAQLLLFNAMEDSAGTPSAASVTVSGLATQTVCYSLTRAPSPTCSHLQPP